MLPVDSGLILNQVVRGLQTTWAVVALVAVIGFAGIQVLDHGPIGLLLGIGFVAPACVFWYLGSLPLRYLAYLSKPRPQEPGVDGEASSAEATTTQGGDQSVTTDDDAPELALRNAVLVIILIACWLGIATQLAGRG